MTGPDPRGPGMAVYTHRPDPTQPRGSRRNPDQWLAGHRAARADQWSRGIPTAGGGGGGGGRSGCALFTVLTLLATCLIGALL